MRRANRALSLQSAPLLPLDPSCAGKAKPGSGLKSGLGLRAASLALVVGLALGVTACGDQGGGSGADAGAPGSGAAPVVTPRSEEQMRKDRAALIATMGAPASPEAAAQYEGDFKAASDFAASSEEPAWELSMTKDFVAFNRANLDPVEGRITQREVRANGLVVESEDLVVTITPVECRFERGRALPFTATVLWNGASFVGCAQLEGAAAGTPPPRANWTVILPAVLAAVDACLQRAEAKPARVTIAYPEGDNVGVRLAEADGGRAECVASRDGATISSYDGLSDRDVFRGERDPLFTRAPAAAPTGRCDDNTPALGVDGAQIGWFTRQKC